MRWIGSLIGSYIGCSLLRGGIPGLIGLLAGAYVGNRIEERLFGGKAGAKDFASMSRSQRSRIFCASAAAMLAKMAKADGRVTQDEIAAVEEAFRRLGFSSSARSYAVGVFRKAKDDTHSIYEYASDFAKVVDSVEIRELLYELLWDIATTDGRANPAEREILSRIPRSLGIRSEWYAYFASRRTGGGGASASRDEVADAYAVLGAKASDSADDLKRKYRELAKRNHPDALRAQGLPEAMVGKATERMSRINSAWATIRRVRGL